MLQERVSFVRQRSFDAKQRASHALQARGLPERWDCKSPTVTAGDLEAIGRRTCVLGDGDRHCSLPHAVLGLICVAGR